MTTAAMAISRTAMIAACPSSSPQPHVPRFMVSTRFVASPLRSPSAWADRSGSFPNDGARAPNRPARAENPHSVWVFRSGGRALRRVVLEDHIDVVVAEGAKPKDGQQVKRDMEGGEFRLGGIGDLVAREIARRTGKETRSCVLGHLQRGGAPTTLDRILGTRFGVKAVQLANEGHFGSMVSYQNYQVRHVPIAEAVNRLRLVPPNGEMVQTARDVEISFGD